MSKLQGEILTLQKMSGSVSTTKSLSGNVGAKTINGATFIPSVSDDGVISWTNDKELPNPEPVNIKGVKGDKGDKGDKGERGEKGDPFTYADFTPEQLAALTGPRGPKGEPGLNGADGAAGADGHTPVKGTDYWTEDDQQDIVNDVLAALPTWEGGSY